MQRTGHLFHELRIPVPGRRRLRSAPPRPNVLAQIPQSGISGELHPAGTAERVVNHQGGLYRDTGLVDPPREALDTDIATPPRERQPEE